MLIANILLLIGTLSIIGLVYVADFDPTPIPINEVLVSQTLGLYEKKSLELPDCEKVTCSWKKYKANEIWLKRYRPRDFTIADDRMVTRLNEAVPLECVPEIFGYSADEAAELFPDQEYDQCINKFPGYSQKMFLDDEWLTMNCSGRFKGKYILSPEQAGEFSYTELTYDTPVHLYKEPVKLNGVREWAMGTCDEDRENFFEQIQYKFRKKPEVEREIKERMEVAKEKFGSTNTRKLIVFILTVDSASRRHFFRKLPITVAYLNALQRHNTTKVFDFKLHNVIGDNSPKNQIPIFTGKRKVAYPFPVMEDRLNPRIFHGDALGNDTLYKHMERLGFVNMMGIEFCANYFSKYMGDAPNTHHLANNFWCGAKARGGYNFEKLILGQRCVGPKMSHEYLLQYMLEFSQGYSDLNQFIFAHITSGHEATGNHIATLDEHLANFLHKFLVQARANDFDFAIFLQADHGMRYGEWYKNVAAFQEHRLPALFFIANHGLLDRVPGSYDSLSHNTLRLVGKLDIHLTSKALSYMPYAEVPRNSQLFVAKRGSVAQKGISLLHRKAPNFRSCASCGITNFWCSCTEMKEISKEFYYPASSPSDPTRQTILEILREVAQRAISLMNENSHFYPTAPRGSVCQQVSFKEFHSVFGQRLSARDVAFKIEFSVNEHPTARYESYIVVGVTPKFVGMRPDIDAYPTIPIMYGEQKARARVFFVKRLDKYSGVCEQVSLIFGLDPMMCVCQPFDLLKHNHPAAIAEVTQNLTPVLASQPHMTCQQVCETKGLKCEVFHLEYLNNCGIVQSHFAHLFSGKSVSCTPGSELSVEVGLDTVYISWTTDTSNFCSRSATKRPVCPCESD